MYVQPFDGSLNPNALSTPAANPQGGGTLFAGGAASAGDNISRFLPPWMNDGGAPVSNGDFANSGAMQGLFGPLMGILQQLMQMLQSLMGYGGNQGCLQNGYGACPPYGNERFFQNAAGSSDGDPHLSFNGVTWNNMASQPDLLNSNSFPGGFQISTQVTPPNAKGVTWNQCATVTLNGGATTVSMNNNGEATITNYGQSIQLAKGESLQIGDGESVTYEQNGSLQVTAQNGAGGRIQTTMTPAGQGVNVDVSAHDVDLGGTLVNGPSPISNPISNPIIPIPNPIGGPISNPIIPIGGPISNPIGGPIIQPYPPVPEPVTSGPNPLY